MDDPILPSPPVGSVQSPVASGPTGPSPSDAGRKPKNKGGRRSTAEEVDRFLAGKGLVTVPVNSVSDLNGSAPGGNPSPVVVPQPFDEAGTRAGLEGLLGAVDVVAQWQFERTALQITEDAKTAEKFGKGAALPVETKALMLSSGVEVCRKHGVSIGPEAGLIGGLGQWALQLRGLYQDLRELAKLKEAKPGQSGKTGVGP